MTSLTETSSDMRMDTTEVASLHTSAQQVVEADREGPPSEAESKSLSELAVKALTGDPNLSAKTTRRKYTTSERRKYNRLQKAKALESVETSQAGTPKRTRSDGNTPPNVHENKKQRIKGPMDSYSEALRSHLKMAIVVEGFPSVKLNSEQAKSIEAEVDKKILGIKPGEVIPRFEDCRFRDNALIMVCADEVTRKWLIEAVKDFKPWDGAILKAINSKDLPKPVKVMTWIAGTQVQAVTVLKMLSRQNPSLKAENWRVIEAKPESNMTQLVLSIEEKAVEALQKLDCRPYYGCRRINFKILSKLRDKTPELSSAMNVGEKDE